MTNWQETELGRIPWGWELKKIIELKSDDKNAIAMGPFGSNIKAENFVSQGVPVIRGTNLNYEKYVDGDFVFLTEEKADELKNSNCKAGDLVFTHRGTIGQVGLIPKNKFPRYVISQSGMKLTVNKKLVDNEFLFYYFKSKYGQHQLLKNEAQVGVPSISNPLTSLKEIEVSLPPLPEQQAIAEVLSSLDDKIDLLHRQNKTLEALAETLFRQWFVKEAEESWDNKRLGDFIEIKHGYAFKGANIIADETDKILVTPGNFKIGGGFNFHKFKYFNSEDFPVSYILDEGDFVVTMTDLSQDNDTLGYPAFIPEIKGKRLLHNQRVGKVLFRENHSDKRFFLYHLMKSAEYRYYVLGSSS